MGQQHNSMEELTQPSLSLFEEGDKSMHHSICLGKKFGEKYAHVNDVSFYYCLYSFTMSM